MLELGDGSLRAHERAGELLACSRADKIYLYGTEIEAARRVLEAARNSAGTADTGGHEAKQFLHTKDMDHLFRVLEEEIRDGDLVLLKGSRGCALERLCGIEAFRGGYV
jgi:UDP-N-acetylmuramoyl-tripeptide--D-alanyl-D-alanine ligase